MPLLRAEFRRGGHLLKPPLIHDISQVLYLPFDKDDGSYARDRSGRNNHGVIYGAARAAGKIGGALSFDGVDDYVRVEDHLSLQLADALTFAAWVKSNITDYGDVWLHVARKYPQLFLVARFNNFFGSIIFDAAGRSYYLGFASGLDMGWHHYVLTYDSSLPSGNLKRYLDGVLIGQATATVGLASTAGSPLYLGGTGTAGLNGLIDEVRIYSRALTAEEIRRIMNMGGI
jgi:hypothetical protein